MSALADTVGSIAALCTTAAFVPQVIKTWRSGSTRDISLVMFLVFCIGVALWLVYGVMIMAWPVIVANVLTLMLAGTILALKVRGMMRGE